MSKKRRPSVLLYRRKIKNKHRGNLHTYIWMTDIGPLKTKDIADMFGVNHARVNKIYEEHKKEIFTVLRERSYLQPTAHVSAEWAALGRHPREREHARPLTFVEILNKHK